MKLYGSTNKKSFNTLKIRAALAEVGAAYEFIPVDLDKGENKTSEFLTINPHGKVPVLTDDDFALPESNAILWYIAAGTPFLPDDAFEQGEVCRWLIYEQSDVMPMIGGLRFRLVTGRFAPDSEAAEARRVGAYEALRILDRHLAEREFLVAGHYTIADIAVYAYSHMAEEADIDTSGFPHFRAWLERVAEQPGFVDDLAPYPPNASVMAGKSIYG